MSAGHVAVATDHNILNNNDEFSTLLCFPGLITSSCHTQ